MRGPLSRRSTTRRLALFALAFLAYVVVLMASLLPMSARPHDTVAYLGDPLEMAWALAWGSHILPRDPLHYLDANILFPSSQTMTYTEHRIFIAVLVAPINWLFGNPILAYNVAIAIACLFAAYAGRRLALVLGISPLGAWTVGALYAFHTYQIHEAARIQVIFHGFLPLALEQAIRLFRSARRRHAVYLAVFMLLQGLSSMYLLLYGTLLIGIVTVAFFVVKPRDVLRVFPALVVAGAIAALVYLPVVVPYLESAWEHDFRQELPVGIGLEGYWTTTPTNLLYGSLGEYRMQQRGPHFVGFVSLGLALAAFVFWRRLPSPTEHQERFILREGIWVPAAIALASLFFLLALGKDVSVHDVSLGPGPYRLLYHALPGFQLVRIPERFSLMAMLFLALLVGYALSRIDAGRFRALAWLLAILVPLEHVSPRPLPVRVPVAERVPAVYRWLSSERATALAELPAHGEGLVRKEAQEMYFSAYHFVPIIHGYVTFPPCLRRSLGSWRWSSRPRGLYKSSNASVWIPSWCIADVLGRSNSMHASTPRLRLASSNSSPVFQENGPTYSRARRTKSIESYRWRRRSQPRFRTASGVSTRIGITGPSSATLPWQPMAISPRPGRCNASFAAMNSSK